MKHSIDAKEAVFIEGFYYQLPLVAYASMPAVSPLLAARLLCAQKPMYDGTHDNEEVKILAPVFEDIAQFAPAPRSMLDWVQIVQTKELAHSEDIAAYLEFRAQENVAAMPEAASTPDAPKPLKSLRQMQPQPNPQSPPALPESKEARQAKRWALCVDAGLKMPLDTYAPLPRGVGAIAKRLEISRQALSQDLKEHAERVFGK